MTDNNVPGAWPVLTPGAWLAGFIKRTFIHCYIQNMKALGLVVSEKSFLCFSQCKSMGANDPQGRAIFDPRGMVGRIKKRTTIHCYIQNIKALGLVVSEKIVFMFFPLCPQGGPVWTPGAQ